MLGGVKLPSTPETKAVFSVTTIVLVGKGLGLVREILFAAYMGGGALADAFAFASLMPRLILDAMFAAAISASFIPVFNAHLQAQGKQAAFALANNFLNVVLALSTMVAAVAWWLAPAIVSMGAPGFSQYYANLTSNLLRIMLPLLILSSMAFSLSGVLQSFGRFNAPAAMSLASNGLVILYYLLLFDKFGVYGLAFVFLAGWSSQLLIQLPSLYSCGFRYRPILRPKEPGLRQVARLVASAMVFAWVLPLNLQVNIFSVSHFVGGSTALNLANTVYSIAAGSFVLSIVNVVFPKLSREALQPDAFSSTLRFALSGVVYLLAPLSIGLGLSAHLVVRVLFLHGLFTPEAGSLTAVTLVWLCVGMVGFGLQTVLSRAFFAKEDGRTPLMAAIMAVGVNALISFGLAPRLGVMAAALGSSLSMTLCAIILFAALTKSTPGVWNAKATFNVLKMLASAISMGFLVLLTQGLALPIEPSFISDIIMLVISGILGVAAYLAISYVFAVEETRLFIGFLKIRIIKIK